MKFFSVVASSIGLMLSAKKTMGALEAAGKPALVARERSELLAVAPEFARGADLLSDLGGRLSRLEELMTGEKDPRIKDRVRVGVDTMRLLSAYYLHTSQDEPFGDFAVRQSAEVQDRWSRIRESVIKGRQEGTNAGPDKGLVGMADMFASLAVATLGVCARVRAKRLAEEGKLDAEASASFVAQARLGQQDTDRLMRSDHLGKIAKMMKAGKKDKELTEATVDMESALMRAKMNYASEIAQIQFLGGDREAALDTLRVVEQAAIPEMREPAREALAKELHWARGNDAAFCSWAIEALSVAPPADDAAKAKPSPKP